MAFLIMESKLSLDAINNSSVESKPWSLTILSAVARLNPHRMKAVLIGLTAGARPAILSLEWTQVIIFLSKQKLWDKEWRQEWQSNFGTLLDSSRANAPTPLLRSSQRMRSSIQRLRYCASSGTLTHRFLDHSWKFCVAPITQTASSTAVVIIPNQYFEYMRWVCAKSRCYACSNTNDPVMPGTSSILDSFPTTDALRCRCNHGITNTCVSLWYLIACQHNLVICRYWYPAPGMPSAQLPNRQFFIVDWRIH